MNNSETEELQRKISDAETADHKNNYNVAEKLCREVLSDAKENSLFRIEALRILGQISWRKCNHTIALQYLHESLMIALQLNDSKYLDKVYNNIGLVYYNLSEYNTALEHFDKSLELVHETAPKSRVAALMNNIGMTYSALSNNSKTLEYYSKSYILFEELGDETAMSLLLGNIGLLHMNTSDFNKAIEYFDRALKTGHAIGMKHNIAMVTGNMGAVYNSLSNYPLALEYLLNSLILNKEIGNIIGEANAASNIGLVYSNLSDYSRSLEYYSRALHLFEAIDNKLGIAHVTNNIGVIYSSILNYSLALEYYKKSLSLFENIGVIAQVAHLLCNIGGIFTDITDYTQALEYLVKAHVIYKELGDNSDIARVLGSIGNVHLRLNNYIDALENYQNSLEISERTGLKNISGFTLSNLGKIYLTSDFSGYNEIKAEDYLLYAIWLFQELGNKKEQYEVYKLLSDTYKKRNEHSKALKYIEKHHELYIEVQNEEVKKQADRFGWERKIAEMEKQKEIDLVKTEAEKTTMQQKIEFQAREVENTIHDLIKKNDLLQQVQSGIQKIKPHTKGEAIAYIEQLLDRVTRNITPLDSISELDKQWTEVHAEFMNKLKENFSELTTMELKIAALLSMKLTSSNIASVLFLSKRTVESHRHSLRKKMGFSATDDIYIELTKYSTR